MKKIILLVFLNLNVIFVYCQNWIGPINDINYGVISVNSLNNKLYFGINYVAPGIHHLKVWDGIVLDSLECVGEPSKIVFHNDTLYECGCIGGIRRYNGNNWDTIGKTDHHGIIDFHFYNNEIYAIGIFDSINGVAAKDIARWDGSNWHAFDTTKFTPGGLRFCTHYNGEFYIGGSITNWNHTINTLVKWSGTSWQSTNIHSVPGSINPFTAAVFNNELYVGGLISTLNNFGNGILRFDGVNWQSVGGGLKSANVEVVYSFHELNNYLYVGGIMDSAGAIPSSMIAAWDGLNWCKLSTYMDAPIYAVCDYSNNIVVGGNFNIIDGNSIKKIAEWIGGSNFDTCSNFNAINYNVLLKLINIFPNPAKDKLIIYSNNIQLDNFRIIDFLGREIYSEKVSGKGETLDVSSLSPGLYFLNLQTPQGRCSKKFVKE
jgi:hypothetical protein